jgi:hypothetical protein
LKRHVENTLKQWEEERFNMNVNLGEQGSKKARERVKDTNIKQ